MGKSVEIDKLRSEFRCSFQAFAYYCLKIRTKTNGIVPFKLNSVQLDLLDKFYEQMKINGRGRFIVLKARQMGLSTFIGALYYWWTIYHRGTKSLVLTHLDSATKELFEMIKRYHDNTPDEFKPKAQRNSTNELAFVGIDSAFKTATAGSKNVGHGSTIQCLHWSEVSRSNNQADMTAGVMQTVPSGDGSIIFLESTANGTGEYFHQTWEAALRGENEYTPVFYPWTAMEEYRKSAEGIAFSQEELDYQSLYGVDDEQLAWRQAKMREFKGSPEERLALFREQYPITPEEAFRSSEHAFISNIAVYEARKANLEPYGAIVCGVDPAAGGKDSTAIVLRQGQKVLKAWRFKHPDLMAIVGRCVDVINDYQVDMMFVDCVGLGLGVYSRLVELGYSDSVMEVKASRRADEPDAYVNKRAEMWDRMAQWFERGADIPDNDIFESDLLSLSAEYDSSRRLKMQSKKDLAHSPDLADALSFTFSLNHVVPKSQQPDEYEGLRRAPTNGGSMLNGNV
ncbi:hypothetical protein D3M79_04170 [Rodentibacter pneumotropicus]|uniref:Terminase n=3 Tax=Rodentibacter pneumotropicus TaxID=758 RepID=A0A4S2PC13_9PAST|nr:hypothetical protein [Rodentibacter pneumotropicus]THA00490.1 hypothetical protein D3M79_04170 [Rodentibacter pneumotropicus]THA00741.1 hypothetical protein D3M74_07160 [Rodentibacter pneumotropicus]THA06998.1 hypothetical protein D3M77_07045 [Rodentibacter pneumotropicus]THA17956.1 hypothetical protein D3M76_00315 [Rodentibacter pneumotropicus]